MYQVSKRQVIIVILLAILFGGASLTNLGSSEAPMDPVISVIRFAMIGFSLLSLSFMSGSDMWNIHIKPLPLNTVWMAFASIVLLSGIFNTQATVIRDGFWFMIVVPMVFFNAIPKLMNKSANILITLGLLLGTSPYIILSLVLNPIWQSDSRIYSGIFPNANQLGFTTTVVSAGVFILAIGILFSKKSSLEILLVNTSLVMCFLIILISNARTSLIAFLCMSALMIWKLMQKPKNVLITFVMAIIIGFISFLFSAQNPWFIERVAEIQSKDQGLSGRNDIWFQTISDMELLGKGDTYFNDNFGIGAHNTIIHILGVNGILAVILIVLFTIMTFYYACAYFQKNIQEDPYAIAPLLFMTCFWILSMGEGMFGSLGNAMTLAYMLSIGVIISDLNTKSQPPKIPKPYSYHTTIQK
jgi:O-antigen ligase